ncbi:spidroin-1 [Triticum aestivum]|uniref:spidroin-1 n=1 Tax=Triticum aestivum TaxID=4565 RepID=UPI001ABC0C6C|nr:spidroin-1-like [Aegilops tauschii subsp. strangulata]XP_044401800.1 spidroin-1-like [Triticum aestivum]
MAAEAAARGRGRGGRVARVPPPLEAAAEAGGGAVVAVGHGAGGVGLRVAGLGAGGLGHGAGGLRPRGVGVQGVLGAGALGAGEAAEAGGGGHGAGAGAVGPGGAALGRVGLARGGGPLVAEAAGNGAGRGAGGLGGGGDAPRAVRRDDADNPLPYWLLGNDNHGADSKKPPLLRPMGLSKINPKELHVYGLTVEYRTGDTETDQMNERLVALYNTLGDKRVELYEKASDDTPSRKDHLDYRKEKEHLMRMIGDLQEAIKDRDAKLYPFPKIFATDPPI